MLNLFVDSKRHVRSGWWIVIFFLILAAILVPTMMVAEQNGMNVPVSLQAVIIAVASLVSQLLYRRPLEELVGKLNRRWLVELCFGGLVGAGLMLVPALFLSLIGGVDFQWSSTSLSVIASGVLVFISVAFAEELLFRGFIFQRLIAGLGPWPAQLLLAGYFLLTHLGNPGMTGSSRLLASINIFTASLIFGLAFIRTRSLAMPLGLHFMANWVQGGLLGFGVSGTDQMGVWKPVFGESPAWLTGGSFGLEASLPGLVCVVAVLILLYAWKAK